ncbi:MAG: DUF411 domain-containing protein [Rhodospirillales bacterium]|nr:DUF411 domain-containing protein [Rhodospirillales bacterium]
MSKNKPRQISQGVTALAAFFAVAFMAAPAQSADVLVYKSPTCGCCKGWVAHMEKNGHSVKVQDLEDLDQIKKMAGVPEMFQACHTAMIDGYVVEGHVPAKDVARLLKERPKVRGIAVPGMPAGSPGMEGPPERYDVVQFQANGTSSVFAKH